MPAFHYPLPEARPPLVAARPGATPHSLSGRRKLFLAGAAVVAVALIVAAALAFTKKGTNPSTPTTANRQKVSIGLLSLMSGDYIAIGQDRLTAIALAKKDLNLPGADITVTAKDSQCEPPKALEAFHQLVSQNHVVAVIGEDRSRDETAWYTRNIVRLGITQIN
jgi:ABC-type branched-subunit amino acid transport system substrate-binding protein